MTAMLSLDEAQARATAATETAEHLRARLTAGEDIAPGELADAEQAEAHAARALVAAQDRERAKTEQVAVEKLEGDREAMQAEWAAHGPDASPAELGELQAAAAEACRRYIRAYRDRLNYLDDLRVRAVGLGFRVTRPTPTFRRSPLPGLARSILAACGRDDIDWSWTRPAYDNETIWGA